MTLRNIAVQPICIRLRLDEGEMTFLSDFAYEVMSQVVSAQALEVACIADLVRRHTARFCFIRPCTLTLRPHEYISLIRLLMEHPIPADNPYNCAVRLRMIDRISQKLLVPIA